jgi:twitching motility protein PilU
MAMMERLLRLLAEKRGSDIFLSPGSPIYLKLMGSAVQITPERLDAARVEAMIREVVQDRDWAKFETGNELNISYSIGDIGSFRINVFRQRGTPACVARFIPWRIPDFQELQLPPLLGELVMQQRGLLLIAGATGSGKSTTLASMIEHRNQNLAGHILTLEDPIEFVFRSKRSIVNQRQIGSDTDSLEIALKNAMRQAPDCILIGEIRDMQTMSSAIAYSQSGHLVLATLHANNANHALNRVVSFYPPENRHVLLADLAATLKAVISQRLLIGTAGDRLPVVELLMNTRHIAELIEQGRLTDIKEAIETSISEGSRTFDQELARMVRAGQISRDEAMRHADSATNLLWMLDNSTPSEEDSIDTLLGSTAQAGNNSRNAGQAPQPDRPPGPAQGPGGAPFSDFLLNV